jgi:iron uptake system EfeUOB component EfeO/EfeM
VFAFVLAWTALTAAVTAVATGSTAGGAHRSGPATDVVSVSSHASVEPIAFGEGTCAPGWRAPNAGRHVFAITNHSSRWAAISLFHWGSGVVVAKAVLRPGGATKLAAQLQAGGAYGWGCLLLGLPRRISAEAQVPSPQGQFVPAVAPVSAAQIAEPLLRYRRYVDDLLALAQHQLATLLAEATAGDLAGAESAWLAAHLTWLKIGQDDGAYGAFGKLGRMIDGTSAGLVGGTSSRHFTGFHRLEFDLWTRHDLDAAVRDGARLLALTRSLSPQAVAADLPLTLTGMANWLLRCHEILEDALRDSLSANDDYGSNSDLASLSADVAATREMLRLLAPFITARVPHLVASAEGELSALIAAINAAGARRDVGIASLSANQRERVDAATDAALATLAPVSDELQVANTT